MTSLFQRRRGTAARTAALTLGITALALALLSSSASAQTSPCGTDVSSAPTGPATVSTASTSFGKVLVEGSGPYAGCSLYMLTSDQLHALNGADFACSMQPNAIGEPCDTGLWPALLTNGAPIAGPGVNPTLLGTVTRTDLPNLPALQQVTYAGQPLYRFFADTVPGDVQGANLFDPVTNPTGVWYLVSPRRGRPATGRAELQLETAPIGGGGPSETVLGASMDEAFTLLFPPGGASFPAYTLSTDSGHASLCHGACSATYWPPVLTSKRPKAGPGVDQNAVGIIRRSDGTHQVTYEGRPLYLFSGDAYLAGVPAYNNGTASINGAGSATPWGVFNTLPPLT